MVKAQGAAALTSASRAMPSMLPATQTGAPASATKRRISALLSPVWR